MTGGSVLTNDGTIYLNKTNITQKQTFFTIYTKGTLTQARANLTSESESLRGIKIMRTANFNSGSNWTIDERIDLEGNLVKDTDPSITTAKLNLNAGSKIIISKEEGAANAPRLVFWGLSNAYMYQANAITDQNGDAVRLVVAKGVNSGTYVSELHLYSEQTFIDVILAADFKIFLETDDAILSFTKTDGSSLSGTKENNLSIFNFSDNKIFVGTHADSIFAAKNYVNAFDADMNKLQLDVVNGWLISAAVPEPAEWAAIFGAFALATAFIRRRK